MNAKLLRLVCMILLLSLLTVSVSAVSDTSFTIVDGKHINTPLCYSCEQVILAPTAVHFWMPPICL